MTDEISLGAAMRVVDLHWNCKTAGASAGITDEYTETPKQAQKRRQNDAFTTSPSRATETAHARTHAHDHALAEGTPSSAGMSIEKHEACPL